jgi:hypothetical protein
MKQDRNALSYIDTDTTIRPQDCRPQTIVVGWDCSQRTLQFPLMRISRAFRYWPIMSSRRHRFSPSRHHRPYIARLRQPHASVRQAKNVVESDLGQPDAQLEVVSTRATMPCVAAPSCKTMHAAPSGSNVVNTPSATPWRTIAVRIGENMAPRLH